jgi:FixJ family two-component response regulator
MGATSLGDGTAPWVAIVDDDPSVRNALARMLEATGLRVGRFASAREYLDASIRVGSPACLVLDIHLGPGGMSGFDLHDLLVAKETQTRIILMTAHDEVPSSQLEKRVGAENYLRKPFSSAALIRLVDRAMAPHAAAR